MRLRYYMAATALETEVAAVSALGAGWPVGSEAVLIEQGVRAPRYSGMVGTVMTIARQEGPK